MMMRTVLILISCIFYFACNDNKAETVVPAPPPPKYYFYPKANVYFDSVNKDYVFLTNDGITWQTQKQIPAAMQAIMDKNVLIDSPSMPVWKDNDDHKLLYSALLYVNPADTMQKKEPKAAVQKAVTDTVKKQKKGLGKLLDKIFGRKKKDKEEDTRKQ